MSIAKRIKAIGAKLTGDGKQSASHDQIQKPSIVHINEHGKPVRVPLASLKRSPSVKKTKTFTGTVVLNGEKLRSGNSNSANTQAKVVYRTGGE